MDFYFTNDSIVFFFFFSNAIYLTHSLTSSFVLAAVGVEYGSPSVSASSSFFGAASSSMVLLNPRYIHFSQSGLRRIMF